jgi:hypothetical protein
MMRIALLYLLWLILFALTSECSSIGANIVDM